MTIIMEEKRCENKISDLILNGNYTKLQKNFTNIERNIYIYATLKNTMMNTRRHQKQTTSLQQTLSPIWPSKSTQTRYTTVTYLKLTLPPIGQIHSNTVKPVAGRRNSLIKILKHFIFKIKYINNSQL